jgi:uncharacterized membrane protein
MTSLSIRSGLVASVALNVFLVGVGGAMIVLSARVDSIGPATRSPLKAAAASLTATHRTAFLDLLRTQGKIAQTYNQQAHKLRDEAWRSLSASKFDPADAEARLAQARGLNLQARGTVEAAVIRFAAALPAGERADFGESMRRTLSRQHPQSVTGSVAPH